MNREEFNSLLELADLNKRDFCNLLDLNYNTINTWGSSNINIPKWVKSWLENYIELRKYENLKKVLADSGICDINTENFAKLS